MFLKEWLSWGSAWAKPVDVPADPHDHLGTPATDWPAGYTADDTPPWSIVSDAMQCDSDGVSQWGPDFRLLKAAGESNYVFKMRFKHDYPYGFTHKFGLNRQYALLVYHNQVVFKRAGVTVDTQAVTGPSNDGSTWTDLEITVNATGEFSCRWATSSKGFGAALPEPQWSWTDPSPLSTVVADFSYTQWGQDPYDSSKSVQISDLYFLVP